jgi:hypothetical protein
MIVEIIIVVEGFAALCRIKNRKSMHGYLSAREPLNRRAAMHLRLDLYRSLVAPAIAFPITTKAYAVAKCPASR